LKGERTQAEAARLLKRSVRQIRRLTRRMEVRRRRRRRRRLPAARTRPDLRARPPVARSAPAVGRGGQEALGLQRESDQQPYLRADAGGEGLICEENWLEEVRLAGNGSALAPQCTAPSAGGAPPFHATNPVQSYVPREPVSPRRGLPTGIHSWKVAVRHCLLPVQAARSCARARVLPG